MDRRESSKYASGHEAREVLQLSEHSPSGVHTLSLRSDVTSGSRKSDEYWENGEEQFNLKQAVEYYLKRLQEEQDRVEMGQQSLSNRIAKSRQSLSRTTGFFSTMRKLGSSEKDTQSVENIAYQNYKEQAWFNGIGLHFKKKSIELAFTNELAVLHRNTVTVGYIIEVVLAILLVILDNLFFAYEKSICDLEKDSVRTYCDTLFGPRANDATNYFNLIYGLSLLALVILGLMSHYIIHLRNAFLNKAWALVACFAVYSAELILLLTLMVNYHSGDNFWPLKLIIWYLMVIGVSIWFTGFLFLQNLVLFVVCVLFYFPLTFKVATDPSLNSGDPYIAQLDSLLTSSLYTTCTHFLLFIHLAMMASSYMNERASRKRFFQRLMITYQQDKIIHEKTKYGKLQKDLLFNMLPPTIVNQLEMQGYGTESRIEHQLISCRHQGVCILFADVAGFSELTTVASPSSVMSFLNNVFESLDHLTDMYNVYKVETVGDCYVAACGVVSGNIINRKVSMRNQFHEDHLSESQQAVPFHDELDVLSNSSSATRFLFEAAAENTVDMIAYAKAITRESKHVRQPILNTPTLLKVGVHTGPCMSGIVGTKNLRYCLFGDTMNTAARMQQNSLPNIIQASEIVQKLTPEERWVNRGLIEMKGKGKVQTYLLNMEMD